MNKVYRIVKNVKTGLFVVASELAKGAKKSSTTTARSSQPSTMLLKPHLLSIALSLAFAPMAHAAVQIDLNTAYNPGSLIKDGNDKPFGIHPDNANNYLKAKELGANGPNGEAMTAVSPDKTYRLDFNDSRKIDFQASTRIPIEERGLAELMKVGAVKIFDKQDDPNHTNPLTAPTWTVWVRQPENKVTVPWTTENGQELEFDAYDLDKVTQEGSISFQARKLVEQPTEPFIHLTLARINDGTMILDPAEDPNWSIPQVKQSSLFIANGTQNQATIKVEKPITVNFGHAMSLGESLPDMKQTEGAVTKLVGSLTNKYLVSEDNPTGSFTINDAASLAAYNDYLIDAVKRNAITTTQYDIFFEQAFAPISEVDRAYTLVYDYTPENDVYYLSDAMKAAVGTRAIIEADGKDAVIDLAPDATLRAIGSSGLHAYNVYAHDGATVNHQASTSVPDSRTQNALVNNAQFTNHKDANLIFGYESSNGDFQGASNIVRPDQVQGKDGVYTNQGTIFTSAPTVKQFGRNIALEISSGATGINEGTYYIGSNSAKAGQGITTGAHIQTHGSFTNEASGAMLIANNKGQGTVLQGGSTGDTFYIDQTNSAISALATNATDAITITNKGTISIGAGAHNTVAINLDSSKELINSNFNQDNVSIKNEGTINVDGNNTVGIKVAGRVGYAGESVSNAKQGIINVTGKNSSGLFVKDGGIAYNEGKILVNGNKNNEIRSKSYGVRADSGKVVLKGADSAINIEGNNTVGVYARVGGEIDLQDDARVTFDKGTNQTGYWIAGALGGKSSSIKFNSNNVHLSLDNDQSTLFRVDQKASFEAGSGTYVFDVSGKDSTGFYIADNGTTLKTGTTTLNISGESATGLTLASGAGHDGKVTLDEQTDIHISGKDASVAVVDGNYYNVYGEQIGKGSSQTTLISEAKLTSAEVAQGATGYKLINGGKLTHQGSIDFTDANNDNTGIYVNGGVLNNVDTAKVEVNGVGVDIYGSQSVITNLGAIIATDGTAAVRLNKGASLTLQGNSGKGTITGLKEADGVRVHSGATLTAQNAQITVDGSGSGIHFLNTDGDGNKAFTLSGSGTITVSGDQASGITLEGQAADGTPTMGSSDLDSSGAKNLKIIVEKAQGNGIVTNTSGNVKSGASVEIQSAQGQSALVVKGDTKVIEQSGNLVSASTTSPVVNLNDLDHNFSFSNNGLIQAIDEDQVAVAAQAFDSDITFINKNQGKIVGQSLLGGGNNKISLYDTSQASNISAKNGNNTVNLTQSAEAKDITLGDGNNSLTLNHTSKLKDFKAGHGNNTVTLNGGTQINTATTGASQAGNQYVLNNVSKAQGDGLFQQLDAGAGSNDRLTVQGNSHYALKDPNKIKDFEQLMIQTNSVFELDNVDIQLNEQKTQDGITVAKGGELYLNNGTKGALTFDHQLAGDGLVRTHANNAAFNFSAQSADHSSQNFKGTLGLGNATFDLAADNTKALTNATLRLDKSGVTTVREGVGVQKIGGLAFNEGSLAFKENFVGKNILDSHIKVDTLDLSNSRGKVEVNADGFDNIPHPSINTRIPLLEQDEGVAIVQLVKADKTLNYAGGIALELKDNQGNLINNGETAVQQDLRQNGKKVAEGTYDHGLQTHRNPGEADDGLYVAYKLIKIDLQGKDKDALILGTSAGKTGHASNLDAQLTGSGDVAINTDSEWVSLSNITNDYSGKTLVQKGKLRLEKDHTLGNTSLLDLASGTQVNLNSSQNNGTVQTIGQLQSQAGSELALADGHLTIKQGGVSDGRISGSQKATLVAENGSLKVNGANAPLAAHIDIKAPASIDLNNAQGLGSGLITNAGKLNLNQAQGVLRNDIEDKGQVNLKSTSIELAGNNQNFAGSFNIDGSSTLQAAVQNHIGSSVVNNSGTFIVNQADTQNVWTLDNEVKGTGTLVKANAGTLALTKSSAQYTGTTDIKGGTLLAGSKDQALTLNSRQVNVGKGTQFSGFGEAKGSVDNQGTFFVGGLDKAQQSDTTQYRVAGNFSNNGGSIKLGSKEGTGSRLYVGGNFVANGGRIDMNTVLNKGHEETETDQLVVAGNVTVGSNGPTVLYITPVGGKGADTFEQPDAIKVVDVGGTSANQAFKLGAPVAIGIYEYLLHKGHNDNSWYLDSYDTIIYPPPEKKKPNPLIGTYLANQSAALSMFQMTLHDRLGEPEYADSLKGQEGASSVWLRVVADRQKHQAADGMLSLKGNIYSTQIGGDIIKWQDEGTGRGLIGLMAAYGNSDYTSRSNSTGSEAKAKIKNAYSLGVYGTWYQDAAKLDGTYVDAWAQYAWFKNEVSMGRSPAAKYNSNLFSASIEAGYTFNLHQQNEFKQWALQPQAQITYNKFDSDESIHASGLKASGHDADHVLTRLGARLTYANRYEADKSVQPFAELNWIHSNANNSIVFNNRYTFKDEIPSNRFEIKVGAEGQLSKNWSVWGNMAHQTGKHSYSAYRAMVGAKYQWQ